MIIVNRLVSDLLFHYACKFTQCISYNSLSFCIVSLLGCLYYSYLFAVCSCAKLDLLNEDTIDGPTLISNVLNTLVQNR